MSEYVTFDMQDALPENLDGVDWAAEVQEIMQAPWLGTLDWENSDLDTETVSGDGKKIPPQSAAEFLSEPIPIQNHAFTGTRNTKAIGKDPEPKKAMALIICDFPRCEKTFKRKSELTRHQLSHGEVRISCPAIDCNRKGEQGFPRIDKLIDHITLGHDDETFFACLQCPDRSFTRDTFAMHLKQIRHLPDTYNYRYPFQVNQYRTCPIPRCSFRINVGPSGKGNLDQLPQHFIDKHDLKGRRMYAQSIRNRGYDPETAEIVCPLCVHHPAFKTHFEFFHHFLETHNDGITPNEGNAKYCFEKGEFTRDAVCDFGTLSIGGSWGYKESPESLPGEIYEHRRTLLSLWPALIWHPVWKDME